MAAPVLELEGVSLKGTVLRPGGFGGLGYGKWSKRVRPWAHAPGCQCQPHQTFTCDRCGRRFGWCLGAYDDYPGACDFCAAKLIGDGGAP